jgi:hypothetical protein
MSSRRRNSPGLEERERWLRSAVPARTRPWAYEELLFGPHDESARAELETLMEDIRTEHAELERLFGEVDVHVAQIARLEERLNLLGEPAGDDRAPGRIRRLPARSTPAGPQDARASSAQRSYALARCEGFQVDSPAGPVGFVEGLRFITRIDRPDLIEVRGGRLGRRLLLVPVEQVEDVRVAEETVVLRSSPGVTGDLLGELVDRVRGALHVRPTVPGSARGPRGHAP